MEERRGPPLALGIDFAEARLDRPVDPRHDSEQALLDDVEAMADLVEDRRPGSPDRVGEPERLDLLGDRLQGPRPLGGDGVAALQSIELKVGQSSIKLDQMGVTIKGLMINVEGQVQTQVKGLMTQVTATAMLKMGGAITMIG